MIKSCGDVFRNCKLELYYKVVAESKLYKIGYCCGKKPAV